MIRQGKGGKTRIPFGPFLAFGAITWVLFQQQIMILWQLYLGLAR
jgi:leader peptidase (prepilin peptidase)/N-methyltransferase